MARGGHSMVTDRKEVASLPMRDSPTSRPFFGDHILRDGAIPGAGGGRIYPTARLGPFYVSPRPGGLSDLPARELSAPKSPLAPGESYGGRWSALKKTRMILWEEVMLGLILLLQVSAAQKSNSVARGPLPAGLSFTGIETPHTSSLPRRCRKGDQAEEGSSRNPYPQREENGADREGSPSR